jgi:hypothetical protein
VTADKHETTILDAIMRVVEAQIQDNDPPDTRAALDRLVKSGMTEKDAKKLIRGVAAVEICNIMEKKEPFQYKRYAEALQRLPKLPWEE